jgi:hypothetical protein
MGASSTPRAAHDNRRKAKPRLSLRACRARHCREWKMLRNKLVCGESLHSEPFVRARRLIEPGHKVRSLAAKGSPSRSIQALPILCAPNPVAPLPSAAIGVASRSPSYLVSARLFRAGPNPSQQASRRRDRSLMGRRIGESLAGKAFI